MYIPGILKQAEVSSDMKESFTRRLKQMKRVVYDKEFAKENPDLKLYEVYRNVKHDKDLRYDITIIQPRMLGDEFVRTKGNRNKNGFQELYTVIEGKALFLLQKFNDKRVEDVFAVKARAKESVIIPPEYWVVIINPSKEETLETENWVSNKTENEYKELEKMKGPCYFYTSRGWVKNEEYEKVPEIKDEASLKDEPESLDFLRQGIN